MDTAVREQRAGAGDRERGERLLHDAQERGREAGSFLTSEPVSKYRALEGKPRDLSTPTS